MICLRGLILAAMAAAVLTAPLGAGTALATEPCSTNVTRCPEGERYLSGHAFHASLEANAAGKVLATLTNNISNITCEESTVEGKTTSNGGSGVSVSGEITALTFAKNCKLGSGTGCTVTVIDLPYPATTSGGGTAAEATSTLTVSDPAGIGATMVCGFLINCTFTTKDATLTIKNKAGGTPTVTAAVSLERSGGICPSTSFWDANYVIDEPDPLFIV